MSGSRKKRKYQEPEFYSLLFCEAENGSSKIPHGRMNTYDKEKYLMIQGCICHKKIRVIVCSIHCHLNFTSLGIKLLLIFLKMKLGPPKGKL